MIYKSRKAAVLSLLEFVPTLRDMHRIIPATIEGKRVGWTRVLISKQKAKQ